jgi:hypothetical protein
LLLLLLPFLSSAGDRVMPQHSSIATDGNPLSHSTVTELLQVACLAASSHHL